MLHNIKTCKSYAKGAIIDALYTYNVVEYKSVLSNKVNDVCLEMGYDCHDDKLRYDRLSDYIHKTVYSISSDEQVRDKLFAYANRVMIIGKDYYLYIENGY